eukprot:5259394-Lingulodinium_polyedra.AAC.1
MQEGNCDSDPEVGANAGLREASPFAGLTLNMDITVCAKPRQLTCSDIRLPPDHDRDTPAVLPLCLG